MPNFFFDDAFALIWGVFGLVWLAGARFTRPAERTIPSRARLLQAVLLTAGFALLIPWVRPDLMGPELWPRPAFLPFLALSINALGCLVAIWARITMGSNWSSRPMVQQGHRLVVSGPYAVARHPIYTGLLLGAVGVALVADSWRIVPGLGLILGTLLLRIRQEEQFMDSAFPEEYPAYRLRVKALIPGIL